METTELLRSSEFWAGFNLAISACALVVFLFYIGKSLGLGKIIYHILESKLPTRDKVHDEKTRKIKAARVLAKHGIIVYRYSYHPCLNDLQEILDDKKMLNDKNDLDLELSNAWFEFAGNMDSYVFLNKEKVMQGMLLRLDIPEVLKQQIPGSHLKIIK